MDNKVDCIKEENPPSNFDKCSEKITATAKDCVYTFSDNCDSDEGELKYKIKNLIQSPKKASESEDTIDRDDAVQPNYSKEGSRSGGSSSGEEKHHLTEGLVEIGSDKQQDEIQNTSSSETEANERIPSVDSNAQTTATATTDESNAVLPVKAKRTPNGSLPKTGKPLAYAIEKKASKTRSRPKRKALVAMYQSQISDNKIGIKLKLKKSDITPPKSKKTTRKRSRKSKSTDSDNEVSSKRIEKRPRKEKVNNNREPVEQTIWGSTLPENCLYKIFQYAVKQEGALPTLVRLGKVCILWNRLSMSPSLWTNLDLSTWTRDRCRTELKLKWLIENRLTKCQDVNFGNFHLFSLVYFFFN